MGVAGLDGSSVAREGVELVNVKPCQVSSPVLVLDVAGEVNGSRPDQVAAHRQIQAARVAPMCGPPSEQILRAQAARCWPKAPVGAKEAAPTSDLAAHGDRHAPDPARTSARLV